MTAETVNDFVRILRTVGTDATIDALCSGGSLLSRIDAHRLLHWIEERGHAAALKGTPWEANPHLPDHTKITLDDARRKRPCALVAATWWAGWTQARVPDDAPDPYGRMKQIEADDLIEAPTPRPTVEKGEPAP